MTIKDLFDKHGEEFLKFDRVVNRFSSRADVHAFVLLDRLFHDTADLICHAEHDEIWLSIVPELLVERADEEQIVDLIRCGVRYDRDTDSLTMFV